MARKLNVVRFIVRSCHLPYCPKGPGISTCYGHDKARTADACQWRAALMHPLDEPENLQCLAPADTPDKFI